MSKTPKTQGKNIKILQQQIIDLTNIIQQIDHISI